MAQSRMIGGVYHPRAKGGVMSDALTDALRIDSNASGMREEVCKRLRDVHVLGVA